MSKNELQVFKKYLENNLSKGFILVLSSPTTVHVLFVKKSKNGL